MKRTYLRGDMYFANLGSGIGSEQIGKRPVLIIQNDTGNRYSPTVIVAAITSQAPSKTKLPTHYYIGAENGLKHPSIVLLEQIRTIDKRRLDKYIGRLDKRHLAGLDHALAVSVDLTRFVSNPPLITLCGICADNFRSTGVFSLCRADHGQTEKESCVYCGQRRGYDYIMVKK